MEISTQGFPTVDVALQERVLALLVTQHDVMWGFDVGLQEHLVTIYLNLAYSMRLGNISRGCQLQVSQVYLWPCKLQI